MDEIAQMHSCSAKRRIIVASGTKLRSQQRETPRDSLCALPSLGDQKLGRCSTTLATKVSMRHTYRTANTFSFIPLCGSLSFLAKKAAPQKYNRLDSLDLALFVSCLLKITVC